MSNEVKTITSASGFFIFMKSNFRFYYDKDYEYLYQDCLKHGNERYAKRTAKQRLRMYANLFNRDMRKQLLNKDSTCKKCNSNKDLHIDHIVPITKGGKNTVENVQVLCRTCNILKSNNL